MKKVCIILMTAFAMTANAAQIPGPIDVRAVASMGQPKSDIPISAFIDGHALTIMDIWHSASMTYCKIGFPN